jgi:capsular exopolysaccharide synthesis family protein
MLARQGLRTLLIDGDLRRAALTGLLKGGRKPGFSEVLSGHSTLASARLPTANENLTFLAAGSCDADTAELMASAKVQALVQEAATQFQRIVIDSPPVNSVSDSLLIVPHVLATCVVIQAGVTPRRAVERACMLVKLANRGVIGAILNQVGTDACSTYETHGYARNSNYTYAVRKI